MKSLETQIPGGICKRECGGWGGVGEWGDAGWGRRGDHMQTKENELA